ncbi:MAG: putative superfamily hydrolase [Gaiellaceae bacterium]|nr:putative superfamily hydrolase [Gaiellaceae bacterium]
MSTIHLIRHAKAKSRLAWEEPDELRPLTKRGRREAAVLAARLGEQPLARLVSSPFVRCVQTLEPLAVALDLPIETTDLLAEGADGARAAGLMLSLSADGAIACCTHGDVLFDVVDLVAESGVGLDAPRAAPVASTWVLSVEDGGFVGAQFVDQPPR